MKRKKKFIVKLIPCLIKLKNQPLSDFHKMQSDIRACFNCTDGNNLNKVEPFCYVKPNKYIYK